MCFVPSVEASGVPFEGPAVEGLVFLCDFASDGAEQLVFVDGGVAVDEAVECFELDFSDEGWGEGACRQEACDEAVGVGGGHGVAGFHAWEARPDLAYPAFGDAGDFLSVGCLPCSGGDIPSEPVGVGVDKHGESVDVGDAVEVDFGDVEEWA